MEIYNFEKAARHSGEYQNPSVNWHYASTVDTGIRRYDDYEDLLNLKNSVEPRFLS